MNNVSGKIWAFIDEEYEVTVLMDTDQQLTLKLFNWNTDFDMIVTLVYAKCDKSERIELWDSMYNLASDMTLLWLVGGDFNVIVEEEEKYGGLPVTLNEVEDFRHCIQSCNLSDLGYKGSIFTRWNGRAADEYVFKRLDRCLGNFELQQQVPSLDVSHLIKLGSDHSPLLVECKQELVKDNWQTDVVVNSFMTFNVKLKKLKKVLSRWSKITYGDFFQNITNLEEVIKAHEALFEADPSNANREKLQKVQAEMTRAFHIEEEYWKQKSGMTWFQEGDKNSIFFHAHLKEGGKDEHNEESTADPTMEEVKHAVFGLNDTSAGGPDGFTGMFFQSCWEIFGGDIFSMVWDFFRGHELPRYITHTNLVLLPKKQNVQTFESSRFCEGRSIVENILLTQEIITDIRLRTKKRNQVVPNVVMKLDMTKAYDRLSWIFLTKVMRKMGFCEMFISFIYELVGNNWYSVLINGQPHGFFHSTRGVKQGDPLSPTIFIIAAESPKINHLAYADDTIIFISSCEISLGLIMRVLTEYEVASGQLINKTKSSVYLHDRVEDEIFQKVERVTGISKKEFPLIYLGCRIYYSRSKMEFYSELLAKAMPMHILAAVDPPSFVIDKLHKIFA
ncbi:uncharacterized protein LOC132630433 [Lycium barbarum]|uniref:uncharacterized protein LOC132630433 n=1 Tax=Lycium barbarum TaxID=112863 RepID=UPI00293ECB29|nr:uncharacterized protein LOC132630433 [Lycium barbarum]